jgi:hypothetical protein
LGDISTLLGVKVQDARSGRPEHESETNIGEVSVAVYAAEGMMETVAVPD